MLELWSWAFWNAKITSKIFYKDIMAYFSIRKKVTAWFVGKNQFFLPPKFCILTSYSGNMNPGLPLKTVSNTFTYGLSKKSSLKKMDLPISWKWVLKLVKLTKSKTVALYECCYTNVDISKTINASAMILGILEC